jgi:hypothetical protein
MYPFKMHCQAIDMWAASVAPLDAIANVGHAAWIRIAHQLEAPREERRIRLRDAELLAHGDHVGLEPQREELRVPGRRLVREDRDAAAPFVQRLFGSQRVLVEVFGLEATELLLYPALELPPIRESEEVERGLMVEPARDGDTERRPEGQWRDPELMRPGRPDARFVDECLPDVQDDPLDHPSAIPPGWTGRRVTPIGAISPPTTPNGCGGAVR